MSDRAGLPPAGWFPDPGAAGMLRWWDGAQWTQHTHPLPIAHPGFAPVDPQRATAAERSTARWARHAVVAYGLLVLGGVYLAGRLFRLMGEGMAAMLANPEAASADPYAAMYGYNGPWAAVYSLINMVQLGIFVLLLVWMYRAATAAAALGIPARRSPGWAVGGWFIPVVNLWFPCQSLRDLLPGGHPARTRILVLWIVGILAQVVAGIALLATFVTADWMAVAIIASVVVAVAFAAGRSVIDDVLDCHDQLAAERSVSR